jgi:hypothetical protein
MSRRWRPKTTNYKRTANEKRLAIPHAKRHTVNWPRTQIDDTHAELLSAERKMKPETSIPSHTVDDYGSTDRTYTHTPDRYGIDERLKGHTPGNSAK